MYHLTLLETFDNQDEEIIYQNLRAYNANQAGDSKKRVLTLTFRNDQHEVIAGLHGITIWNWLFVQLLWVHESERHHGLGRKLLTRAEEEARTRGCAHASLDTFSFQAPGFYEKLGYEKFGELVDCPPGHTRSYYQKHL